MTLGDHDAQALAAAEWDVVVVGTGMGGATLGHALAKSGWRVLFCERGHSHIGSADALAGDYPEQLADTAPRASDGELARAGRYADRVADRSSTHTRRFRPFIGSGTGGSSALYGMALERFFPCDFTPRQDHAAATGAALVDEWPVGYQAFEPYYEAAERLYRVRGTADPLRVDARADARPAPFEPPPALSPGVEELSRFFSGKGLHPYRLPQACEFVAGCTGCQGYLCSRQCKNDAARVCLAPAVGEFGAVVLDQCEVTQVEADHRRAIGVACRRRDTQLKFRGKVVVLAAGALQTPNLLLRSRSPRWPAGLANTSGLVGRHLMRHFVDLYLVRPSDGASALDNRHKELAFNDFYRSADWKLGSVQSFGRLPPAPMLHASLKDELSQGRFPWLAPALSLGRGLMEPLLHKMVNNHLVLATVIEDLPYAGNRVLPMDEGGVNDVQFQYRVSPQEQRRIATMRALMAKALHGRQWRRLKQAENNERLAHVCGTCRFGSDPHTSVLDRYNRAHDLDNLYVVDSAFFPSSGGTNPALTIAANALRVAEHLNERLGAGRRLA